MPDSPPLSREARALLALLLLGQFLVVLDISVVNVALPSIQSALGLSSTGLQWVVNGYTIAYAGFLLLGGRLADVIGQRRAFMAGVALFAAGSLVGGLAGSSGVAAHGARRAGARRRRPLPRDADDPALLVRRGAAARAGDGLVDGDRRRGRRHRRPGRRRAHGAAVLALGAAGERPGRARGPRDGGAAAHRPRRRAPAAPGRARRRHRHRRPRRARVRDHADRGARLDLRADARAHRGRRRAADDVRRAPAPGTGAAPAA